MSYDPLLVGEDSSVYITAVSSNQGPDTVLALDPSGVPKWSAPLFNPTLNTIGADGSAYVEYWQSDLTTHLAKLDPNGAFSAPFSSEAPVAEPQAQEAAYWTLGSWNALLQNRTMFASLASDLLQTADSQRPSKGGSAHKTNGPSLPVIDHFFPAPLSDYGVTGSYANLEQGFKDTVTGTVAKQTFWEGNAATIDDFLKQLAKPVAAVSFVGHSFDVSAQPGGFVSVGLRFGLSGLSALARITPDPNNPNLDYTISDGSTPTFVTHINTQAKVVFVGSCFVGPIFEALWNIDQNTKGRVLIVPSGSQTVVLGHAIAAWQNILDDMVNHHMNAGDAIKQTNGHLPTLVDNSGKHLTEQYEPIGDAGVSIKK